MRTVSLSSADVKRMMLEKGYTVERERLRGEAAMTSIMESKGIYDTNLSADASHQIDKGAQPSPLFGNRIDTTLWGLGLNKHLPSGTDAGIEFKNERLKYYNSINVGGQPLFPPNALYEPIIAFTVNQPILKNAGGYVDRRTIKSAELGSLSTVLDTQRQIERLVYGALNDYWNLVIIRRLIHAKQRSVQFARQFLETTNEEFKIGTAEETDVIAARANVLVRKDELLNVKEVERVWQENLRVKLGIGPDARIDNVEKKPHFIPIPRDESSLIGTALANRRDYKASKRELELREVSLQIAKNQRWPSMDLYSSLELNNIQTSYGNAVGGMDNPNWTVGMQFSIPLENRAARAGKKRADIQKASAIVALKDLENRIANAVARHAREVKSRQKIVTQSKRAWDLQREKLGQEMRKYEMGRSTSDLIVRYQDDVVNAQLSHFDAWLNYKTAALNLALSEGKLVEFDTIDEENVKE
jgi:outer membrane protein TolC